jgi:predicted RNA binding protein YcfA (HicA-like mRNA interferase family)
MKAVSGKRLCQILERAGWILQRVQGSHHIYSHPTNPAILTVPVHGNRDLKKGTLHKLMKDAELTETDF